MDDKFHLMIFQCDRDGRHFNSAVRVEKEQVGATSVDQISLEELWKLLPLHLQNIGRVQHVCELYTVVDLTR